MSRAIGVLARIIGSQRGPDPRVEKAAWNRFVLLLHFNPNPIFCTSHYGTSAINSLRFAMRSNAILARCEKLIERNAFRNKLPWNSYPFGFVSCRFAVL